MKDEDLQKLTLASAARLIRSKELSPVELTAAVINRIERFNDRMLAFISVMADEALAAARTAESELARGSVLGMLHGVPVSVKDLFDTKGVRTTAGMKVFTDRVPGEDAFVVKKLYEAGAVIVGKNNMHEAAYGITNVNPHFGTARNPWNPQHITGGSSGGSASAVAMRMSFGSLGSDTGGSIRVPASLCGVVGLKPTYGRCSLRGVVPLSWSMDHPGPIANSVEDVALLLETIAPYDERDPLSRNRPVPRYAESLMGSVKGLRVGIPRGYFFEDLQEEVEKAMNAALAAFERLGASLMDIDLATAPLQRGIWNQIACPEAYSFHEKHLNRRGEDYGADVRTRLELGRLFLSIDYVRAQRARTLMRDECERALENVDVIITPSVPITPPRIGQTTVQRGAVTEPVGVALTRCTRHFNITGLPAISLPCGFTTDGLPIGLQIAGRAFDESTVLRAAHAYEQEAALAPHSPPGSGGEVCDR
jgi:aspartyl-tRNA(Asn)/glutamyl-tRNA(Gln) amidotransferase subunit A